MKPFFAFLSAVLAGILVFTHAHPAFVAMAVTSFVSLVYQRFEKYPRVHALFQILAGMGFDVPKIADGFSRVLTGKTVGEAQLSAVKSAVAAVGSAVICLAILGCAALPPATSAQARATARGAVETAESAWSLAAQACVDSSVIDATLPAKCSAVLLPARTALIAAAGAVDAWDSDTGTNLVACELQKVSTLLSAVGALGVKLPTAVVDAQTLAANLTCSVPVVDASVPVPSDSGAQ